MDRYEFEGPGQLRWSAEWTGDRSVKFSVAAEEGGPCPAVTEPTYSDVIGPELLRVVEERDQLREKVKTLDANLTQAGRDIRTLEAEVRELGEEVDTLQEDVQRAGKIGHEAGYAQAEADIRDLIERRERNWRACDGSDTGRPWILKATECASILVDIGHGAHRRPGFRDLPAAPSAPEMMDTPDGPRPLPDSIDAAAYAFPDTAPNPAGGEVGPPFRNNFDQLSEITPKPLTTADVRRMRQELAAKMGPERPAGAFSRFWVKNLPEEPDQFTPVPAPAELEGWLARLEERVGGLEKAVGEITVTSEATLLDLEPLRRLAEVAQHVERTEPDAKDLSVPSGRVLRALREAGVIPE